MLKQVPEDGVPLLTSPQPDRLQNFKYFIARIFDGAAQ